jgi:SurA N-terminal domain
MAMLITKFHRLIQSKILWLLFLVIIVFSFVIWGTQMPTTEDQAANDAGKLNGESIPFEKFQEARFHSYLSAVLMSGRQINITPEIDEQLTEMAWQRIASLQEAERLGLTTSDEEIVKAIQSLEFLQSNGQFNPQAYEGFYQQFLAPLRASKKTFDEHVRQEILLQKLRVVMDRMLLVTPMEIQRTYNTLTDTFEVEYVKLDTALVADNVSVSEEDVLAYFSKEPATFTLAEKVKVEAAVFPVADYTNEVVLTDEQIEEYYDFNMEKFALEAEQEADTNLFSTAATKYRPLEEVKEEIRATLSTIEAAVLAEAKANEFVQQVSDRRAEGREVFEKIAADMGIELIMTTPFTIIQTPKELDAGLDLTRAAFNLSDDNDYYYSDPLKGTNHVYVLSLIEKIPERIPEFTEVKKDVEKMAREFAMYNALTEKAQEVRESAIAGISAGLSFDDTLAAYDLTAVSEGPFTIQDTKMQEDLAAALIRPLLVLNENEVTELIQLEDGILLGYVKSRKPSPDVSALETMKPQIINMLRREFSRVSFQEMQQYILKRDGFEDNLRKSSGDDTDVDADVEDEESPEA